MPAARAIGIGMLDRRALVRIRRVDLQMMLIIVVTVFVAHVAAMQVVGVIPVFDLGVTTVLAVYMVMIIMYVTFFLGHCQFLPSWRLTF